MCNDEWRKGRARGSKEEREKGRHRTGNDRKRLPRYCLQLSNPCAGSQAITTDLCRHIWQRMSSERYSRGYLPSVSFFAGFSGMSSTSGDTSSTSLPATISRVASTYNCKTTREKNDDKVACVRERKNQICMWQENLGLHTASASDNYWFWLSLRANKVASALFCDQRQCIALTHTIIIAYWITDVWMPKYSINMYKWMVNMCINQM